MAHKDRKTTKKRGSKTHGYGGRKKHRGAGHRGGVGKAGGKKHKWSFISKNFPGYFGGKGFKRPQKVVMKEKNRRCINVGDIEKILSEGVEIKKGGKIKLDLKSLGYDKLLGRGQISHAFLIKVDGYSSKALKKVEGAGGKIES